MNHPSAPTAIFNKLQILTDAAKYDVACTSSGVSRKGVAGSMGNCVSDGICHSFASDGRCISLLKVLMSNECAYDCKYCINRHSNDVPRASFEPEELVDLTLSFYRRNYIEGLFLSSGVRKNPDFTMEQIYEVLYTLRNKHRFNGYIHVKAIPGADPVLIEKVGWLADRMSSNLELPTAEGLRKLAPQKSRKNILTPMKMIQLGRRSDMDFHGIPRSQQMIAPSVPPLLPNDTTHPELTTSSLSLKDEIHSPVSIDQLRKSNARFVPAGQSTQMIVGATEETDYEIVHVAEALYKNFDLKRVFYSAFVNTTHDDLLPMNLDGPPLLREHRLYQADFLMRFYHFSADEIISADYPNLNEQVDPKCNWALNHLEHFPVEVQTASYKTLLRVPGIGVKSAKRIIAARRSCRLRFEDLKRMGIVLKRAAYFICCNGKTMFPINMNANFILSNLLCLNEKLPPQISGGTTFTQLSLEDLQR